MNLVFIVGTGRCGSTLVNDIIAGHENVSFISEAEDQWAPDSWKGRFYRALGKIPLLSSTNDSRGYSVPSEAYRLIAREVSPIYVRPCRDLVEQDVTPWLQERFRSFFLERYKKYGKPVLVHKYTGWSRIQFFSKIFPEARFINIVRDGRAVANSWLQVPWGSEYDGPSKWLWGELSESSRREWEESNRSFVTLAGIAWKTLMRSYEISSGGLSSEKFMTIRYEDFLSNPNDVMNSMLSFAGLEWSSEFANHFGKYSISTARKKAFEKDLSPTQLSELETTMSDMLRKYSYL